MNVCFCFVFDSVEVFLIIRIFVNATPLNTIFYFLTEGSHRIIPQMRIFVATIKIKLFYHISHNICLVNGSHVYLTRKSALKFKSFFKIGTTFHRQIPSVLIFEMNVLRLLKNTPTIHVNIVKSMGIRSGNQRNAQGFTERPQIFVIFFLFFNIMMLNFKKAAMFILSEKTDKPLFHLVRCVIQNRSQTSRGDNNVV